MKKNLLFTLLGFTLFSFTGLKAQDSESKPHKLSKFITIDLMGAFRVGSDPFNTWVGPNSRYGVSIGYEHFLKPRLSLLGEVYYSTYSYDVNNSNTNYSVNDIGILLGLRYRLIQSDKFNFFGEMRGGYNYESFVERNADRQGGGWSLTGEVGFGLEYFLSDRIKTTVGVSANYSGKFGFSPKARLGLQMKLGK